jgi:hypothetical protein
MTKECERRAAKANGAATGAALDEASLVLLAVPPEADGSWPDGLWPGLIAGRSSR